MAVGTAAALGVAGCGEARHPGQGVVRFDDGEPLRAGSLELRGVGTKDHYAAKIDREGRFRLASRDGAPGVPPGEYQAVVVLIVMTDHLRAEDHDHGRNVPQRYGDYASSGLVVSVPAIDAGPIEVVLEAE